MILVSNQFPPSIAATTDVGDHDLQYVVMGLFYFFQDIPGPKRSSLREGTAPGGTSGGLGTLASLLLVGCAILAKRLCVSGFSSKDAV